MLKLFYKIAVITIFSFCTNMVFGQAFNPYQHSYQGWNGEKIRKANFVRAFLNKFSVNANFGYGRTFYNSSIESDVFESPDDITILNDYNISGGSLNYTGVINWLNQPTTVTGNEILGPGDTDRILSTDSAGINYSGSGYNIPVNISLHIDIERFRIGGGIMYELHGIKQLNPKEQGIYPYVPNFKATTMFRYYFTAGAKVYHIKGWDYNVDFQIGKVKYGSQYDKTALQNGLYFNLGVPLEYELSEYFWLVVRPSFDFKSYNISMPSGTNETSSIQHNQPAFYLNIGVRMKLPEIKRCPVKSCKTQLKHVHGGKEFRGQPFYKEQNPKIGELYPNLEQNKRKNREKSTINKQHK